MIIWKVADDSLGQKFALPYPKGEAPTAIRKTHYQNSRMALLLAIKEVQESFGMKGPELKSDDLEIIDHHVLKNHQNLLVSLAHTRGLAAAVCAPKSSHLHGIGIDCESCERPVRPSYLTKFETSQDRYKDPLSLWCAKEAAFKACSYYWKREKTFVLKDIVVMDDSFVVEGLGNGSLKFYKESDHLICVATLEKLF